MSDKPSTDFSDPKVFEYWAELAQKDPARFEHERKKVIDAAISEAPKKHQLLGRQLQSRIDAARVGNPVESLSRLRTMMLASLARLGKGLKDLVEEVEEGEIRRRCLVSSINKVIDRASTQPNEERIFSLFKE